MFFELLLFIIAIIIIYIYVKILIINSKIDKIPGPPGLPVIGNALDFLGSPEELFKIERVRNQTYPKINKVKLSFIGPVVVLFNPEDIELVLSNPVHNKKSIVYDYLNTWLGTGLLTSSGRKWQEHRKLLTPAFHFSILKEYLNIFISETEMLLQKLDEFVHEESTDIVPLITHFTLQSIYETAMGNISDLPEKIFKDYKKGIYKMGEYLVYRTSRIWLLFNAVYYNLTRIGREEKKLINFLHDFSRTVINARKLQLQKRDDLQKYSPTKKRLALLDLLLRLEESGANINEEEIREEVDTFMFEGHDTTSMAISFTLMLLACNRDVQDKIVNEISDVLTDHNANPTYQQLQNLKYMDMCLKECLRLYPSVPLISRVAGEEIKTATGFTIPKQVAIAIYIYDMHRDPDLYPEPEKFDPERFLPENTQNRHPFAYIPFSAGPRNCIGQKFAMLELKTVLCGILRKYVVLPVDTPDTVQHLMDMVIRSKNGIRVKLMKRN